MPDTITAAEHLNAKQWSVLRAWCREVAEFDDPKNLTGWMRAIEKAREADWCRFLPLGVTTPNQMAAAVRSIGIPLLYDVTYEMLRPKRRYYRLWPSERRSRVRQSEKP